MDYQKLILAGNVTRDAERKSAKSSDTEYTTFTVAVSDSKNRTTYFPITLFDPLGESLLQYLTKGRQVIAEGRISFSDKGYMNVIADRVALGSAPKKITPPETDETPDSDEATDQTANE